MRLIEEARTESLDVRFLFQPSADLHAVLGIDLEQSLITSFSVGELGTK